MDDGRSSISLVELKTVMKLGGAEYFAFMVYFLGGGGGGQ